MEEVATQRVNGLLGCFILSVAQRRNLAENRTVLAPIQRAGIATTNPCEETGTNKGEKTWPQEKLKKATGVPP